VRLCPATQSSVKVQQFISFSFNYEEGGSRQQAKAAHTHPSEALNTTLIKLKTGGRGHIQTRTRSRDSIECGGKPMVNKGPNTGARANNILFTYN